MLSEDSCGNADGSCTIRYVAKNQRHCPYFAVVANANIADYLGVCPKLDVVTNGWNPAALVAVSYRNALSQGAVGANHDIRMNEDVAKMPDAQARPYTYRFRNADCKERLC